MIRWRLSAKRIELTPDVNRKDVFSTINFVRTGGTKATNRECARNLIAFVRHCGIEHQWRADGIDEFHKELWKAAVNAWGRPIWRSVETRIV